MDAAQIPAGSIRRALLARLAVVVAAVLAGLALQDVLAGRLAEIDALAKTDLLAARAQLARVFQIASVSVFGVTGALGGMIAVAGLRKRHRFPKLAVALGTTLVLASAAGGGLMWYMAAVLRACRAGVTPGV